MPFIRFFSFFILCAVLFLLSCNSEENPRLLMAGESSKTWVFVPEDAEQEEGAALSERPEDKWVFYANGTFQELNDVSVQDGSWNYNAGQNELEVVFEDRTAVFHVQELEENELVLHAADGTGLRLQPE